ncbi:type I restriction-modification system subunit M [Candidatus Thiodictyon syntrophicum]|jgi:type I restriction enzyme M protein|uniref:site-specific DNA-methyltransferase (adenine-specific) n=1 Tax=Candidatus Thiodictyon syntrophicum TaxID=1166950 RepID=A0A2K8U458_9GAMM|nr:class I SAM-dependent DNA methyltransferase [Candidatus Thiodictyon syntrophicum]AUB80376.1 N-6 DNA methylase [Candidatus Thiodictyon syntrophicum]
MDHAQHNRLVSFIWGIADDVLRDVYQRGKYRDCILPMVVIRRLDVVLGPTKAAVLAMHRQLDEAGVANQSAKLREVAGQAFYNASPFRLDDIPRRDSPQRLKADFERYLDGFSPNVQQILKYFKFRNQIPTLVEAGILGALIDKFLDPDINLSSSPVLDADGRERLPALDNHGMSTVFEELLRRFNEENNEEAGEHFTPRDVVGLMSELIFAPIADRIESSTYLVLDDACGTGGMLTVAEDRLLGLARAQGKQVSIRLYGQEVNPETYAITTADLLLKGEGEQADQIVLGSTLSSDAFRGKRFDFMLANPPYGKSWKTDLERLGGKAELQDPRFIIEHAGEPDYSLVTRSSDGQLMFLANKLAKMVDDTPLGSRIAEVHNGSSLFTGDAGSGESNIRRWAIENDWLEAIVALPLSLFYNTGIATYIWVLSNRKAEHRRGRVQLIDATGWYRPLRKNLGKKGCELGPQDIARVIETYQAFTNAAESKVFPNRAFGYWKVRVERPLRLRSRFTRAAVEALRYAGGDEEWRRTLYARFGADLYDDWPKVRDQVEAALIGETADGADADEDAESPGTNRRPAVPEPRRKRLLDPKTWARDRELLRTVRKLHEAMGDDLYPDHNLFRDRLDTAIARLGIKLGAADKKRLIAALSWRDEEAPPVIKTIYKPGRAVADPLHGLYVVETGAPGAARPAIVEYEPDPDLRDTEQVPFLEETAPGDWAECSIKTFFQREVLPHCPDAWLDGPATRIGYEISFTRYFYRPKALRTLAEIRADIEAEERRTVGLLDEILVDEDDWESQQ